MALTNHFRCAAHDLERYSDFYDEDRINRAFAYMQGEAAAQSETAKQPERKQGRMSLAEAREKAG